VIVDGRRRAKRAEWFVGVPWQDWLARPVQDIRRELGVDRVVGYQEVRSQDVDVRLVA